MQILHVVFGKNFEAQLGALRCLVHENPSVLACASIRKTDRHGVSLLFATRSALDLFVAQYRSIVGSNEGFCTKEFEIPTYYSFDRPIIILGAPRAGTTLLFETLAQCAEIWTIGGESHSIIERGRMISGDRGHRLDAADADPRTCQNIRAAFLGVLRNRQEELYIEKRNGQVPLAIRFLEKTPRNSLRIPFVRAIFPDCLFIYIYREPESNIASLVEGWHSSQKFTRYRLGGQHWKFLLPPGWPELVGKPILDIATAQWKAANSFILQDLAQIPRGDWHVVRYEDLVSRPADSIRRISVFAGLRTDEKLETLLMKPLPFSRSTLTPPSDKKWLLQRGVIDRVLPSVQDVISRMRAIEKLQ